MVAWTSPLPAVAVLDASGHVDAHNKLRAALTELRTVIDGQDTSVQAADITDATTVGRNVLKAANAAAARTAIGAGTSDLALGSTSTTAMAGDTTLEDLGGTPVTIVEDQAAYDAIPSPTLGVLYVVK